MLGVSLSSRVARQMVTVLAISLSVLVLVQLALLLESSPAGSHSSGSVDFADADSDGVRDSAEARGDTDGDGVLDVDDPDDDGDGIATADENSDPNGDGFPADAADRDGDAQPDFLDAFDGHHTDLAAPVRVERLDAPSDGGRFGTPEAIGDVNGDGVVDLAVGAFSDDGAGEDVGALWVLLMATDGTVRDARRISAGVAGFAGNLLEGGRFGFRIAGLGDLNGDGVPDIAVSAYRSDRVHDGTGEVWVLFLNPDATVKDWQVITEGFGGLEANLRAGDEFGVDVAAVGDLDGDGVPDLAVGMWRRDGLAEDDGGVLILLLRPDGTVKDYQEISAVAGWADSPVGGGSGFGVSVDGIGDLNGDGIMDLAVGSIGVKNGRGKVWIFTLNANGTVSTARSVTPGRGAVPEVAAGGRFGSSVAGLGDIDGDGTLELAVGAFGVSDSTGAAWILDLDATGAVVASTRVNVAGIEPGDLFGHTLASLGDLDGDGAIDLVVGAPGERSKGAGNGSIYMVYFGANAKSDGTGAAAVGEAVIALDISGDAPRDGVPNYLDYNTPVVAEHVHPPAQVLGRVVEREEAAPGVDSFDPEGGGALGGPLELPAELARESAPQPEARVVPAQEMAPLVESGFAHLEPSAAVTASAGTAAAQTVSGSGGTGSLKVIALIASLSAIGGGAWAHLRERRRIEMGRHAA